jgi:hypothetical protein
MDNRVGKGLSWICGHLTERDFLNFWICRCWNHWTICTLPSTEGEDSSLSEDGSYCKPLMSFPRYRLLCAAERAFHSPVASICAGCSGSWICSKVTRVKDTGKVRWTSAGAKTYMRWDWTGAEKSETQISQRPILRIR